MFVQEHEVESEEDMSGLNFVDSVKETWFDLDLEKTEPYESFST